MWKETKNQNYRRYETKQKFRLQILDSPNFFCHGTLFCHDTLQKNVISSFELIQKCL